MGILSNFSGKSVVKIFKKFGYIPDHQTGSHIILFHKSKPTLSIPNHKELAPGLLRSLIRKSGISVEDFLKHK
ncbi:YcfA-like protein [bacterium BMS3Abin04]|nr:YcfA-like protein [bacterium BMS3Abin04]